MPATCQADNPTTFAPPRPGKPVPPPPASRFEDGDFPPRPLTPPALSRRRIFDLTWYDAAVGVLIVASLLAGVACIVRGL